MSIVYLSLGSNIGNTENNIKTALDALNVEAGKIIRTSSFFYSPPWGFDSPNVFCNVCTCLYTQLSPFSLLDCLHQIENRMGRKHNPNAKQYEDRIIDIDIILYDNLTIKTPSLTIPHPLYKKRDFVLIPLQEIYK